MIIFNSQSMPKNQQSVDMVLAKNLLEFHKLNSLPMNLNLDKLDEGSGIAETLKSCTFCHVSQVMLLKIYISVVKPKGSKKELESYLVLRKLDVL